MNEAAPATQWSWPITPEIYDRTIALTDAERAFLAVELPARIKTSRTRQPSLAGVRRLAQPLEDIFGHIGFHGAKRRSLLLFLLEETGRRDKSFWGWVEPEWIEIVNRRRYDGNRLIAVAFLLGGFQCLDGFGKRRQVFFRLAQRIFGPGLFANTVSDVKTGLTAMGYRRRTTRIVPLTLAQLLLSIRSARIEDLTIEVLEQFQRRRPGVAIEKCVIALSHFLASKGMIATPVKRLGPKPRYFDEPEALLASVPADWARLARYWHDTSILTPGTRLRHYYRLLCVGRWLRVAHPAIEGPEQWTRSLAAESVAMLANQTSGQWAHLPPGRIRNAGKPYAASTRIQSMTALRTFFQDLQQWDIIPARFEPYRAFRAPRSLTSLIQPNPRILADDVWAKLIWAGMNLAEADLSVQGRGGGHYYPLTLVRALTLVWLFGGLRWNEIRRLRLGCVRWQEDLPGERVCLLSVPVNKTGTAFSKPVDKLVGEAIEAWENVRPVQPKLVDPKTGEQVDFLFLFRFRQVGYGYLNLGLIPTLCKKAGIPNADVRGNITSHRARSTIASQLFNARDPMSLFEVQEWLGHKHPSSTQHYARVTPTKLMKAYAKAGYFERNIRAIEVLMDQDVVWRGMGAKEPWKFFDLGHGYCTYDFFDQCPHRMACAKCSFYVPKESARAQMLEARSNLVRLRQDIPLNESELAAIDEGLAAYDTLVKTLQDVPTPSGQTPRELTTALVVLPAGESKRK